MRDSQGREVDHLRVSVTRRCNLSCPYCHHEGDHQPVAGEASAARLIEMVREAAGFGIKKVKITGGEPLLRQDIADIIRGIKAIGGIEEVSLTTNGFMLAEKARELKSAGLDRVNIGCERHHLPLATLAADFERRAERVTHRDLNNRAVYVIGGVSVEVVAPSAESFCHGCRRMRITASGEWKPCLRREEHVPYTRGSYVDALARRRFPEEEAL